MARIFTHMHVDLDAIVSVWLVKMFLGFQHAVVHFVPANWNGEGMTSDDIAVDISCGIKGLGSHCAAWALWTRIDNEDQRNALENLINYVDIQDSTGNVINSLDLRLHQSSRMLDETGLNSIFRGIQGLMKDDGKTLEFMETILNGLYEKALSRVRAEQEANSAEIHDQVAIICNAREFGTNGVLFERGVKAVIYLDGNNVGIVRRGNLTVSMSHPDIQAVVPKQELPEWFSHPAGFLFSRGTRKAPAATPSTVNLTVLASALNSVF